MGAQGFADTNASISTSAASGGMATSAGFGSSNVVAEARRYIGGNPTSRRSLWCARFMNMVLERSGHHGTIAVMGRRGGGHVGVVSGIDAGGNPIVVSGNNGNRVRETPVSRGRIYAYVMPN